MSIDNLIAGMAECGVPEHCREGLAHYLMTGSPVGHFLHAVLENDLKEAVNRADSQNQQALACYVIFLYNYAPVSAWGSPEKVARWRDVGGLTGMTEAAKVRVKA